MKFKSFHWPRKHGCPTNKESVRLIFRGMPHFSFSFNLVLYFGGVLIKQLLHLSLLDMRQHVATRLVGYLPSHIQCALMK